MPRGGKNHAQGGGEIAQVGENFRAHYARAGQYISFPPWPILVVRPCPFMESLASSFY